MIEKMKKLKGGATRHVMAAPLRGRWLQQVLFLTFRGFGGFLKLGVVWGSIELGPNNTLGSEGGDSGPS